MCFTYHLAPLQALHHALTAFFGLPVILRSGAGETFESEPTGTVPSVATRQSFSDRPVALMSDDNEDNTENVVILIVVLESSRLLTSWCLQLSQWYSSRRSVA
ncbi:hypothetical protein F5888DRAFT_1740327 [Russula emetica]|nr:hypothetical protein F5888DRAFT_1740327 [Russula emetica]